MAFEGRVAVITGGGSGLGARLADELVRRGAKVVIADRFEESLGKTKKDIESKLNLGPGIIETKLCDVTSWDQVSDLFKFTISKFGFFDMVYANAGLNGAFDPTTEYDLDPSSPPSPFPSTIFSTLKVNLEGVMITMELARSHMLKNNRPDNLIVATSSEAGFRANNFSPFYAASKHAVVGATYTYAKMIDPSKIRFKLIESGKFDTASMTTVDRVMDAFLKVSENKDLNGLAVRVLPPRDIAMNEQGSVDEYPGWGSQNYYSALERVIARKVPADQDQQL